MQTALNWLEQEFIKLESITGVYGKMYELIEQAKQIEKQQIMMAIKDSWYMAKGSNFQEPQEEQYYKETYGSKGSDDKKEPKDIVLGYKTSLEAQMLDSQLPQTEISDEEIEKAWSIVETTHIDEWVSFKLMFIEGAKWYREQLKKKQ